MLSVSTIHKNVWYAVLAALAILTVGLFLMHNVAPVKRDLAATGFLFDIVITFPVIYYFLVIQPLKLKKWGILLVVTCCCAIGYIILPVHQRNYIIQLRKLTAGLELIVLIYAISKIRHIKKAYHQLQNEIPDIAYNLHKSMVTVLGNGVATKFMASELTILRFGLLFWMRPQKSLLAIKRFSIHKETGYPALFGVILFVCFVEITALHLLLLHYSPTAAIIVTILSIYGTIFVIGDFSAILKSPVLILQDQLLLRTGLRWRALVDINKIVSVEKVKDSFEPGEHCFKGGLIKSGVNILFTFVDSVNIERIYRKPVSAKQIAMTIDQADEFIAYLNQQLLNRK
jgi:hypothetical protein